MLVLRGYVKFLLSSWKTYNYVQFDGMVYQQIVGIPIGTNCAPFIADSFLYCYERDIMSDLHIKRFDLIISSFVFYIFVTLVSVEVWS